jgi:hypothetical protein
MCKMYEYPSGIVDTVHKWRSGNEFHKAEWLESIDESEIDSTIQRHADPS